MPHPEIANRYINRFSMFYVVWFCAPQGLPAFIRWRLSFRVCHQKLLRLIEFYVLIKSAFMYKPQWNWRVLRDEICSCIYNILSSGYRCNATCWEKKNSISIFNISAQSTPNVSYWIINYWDYTFSIIATIMWLWKCRLLRRGIWLKNRVKSTINIS